MTLQPPEPQNDAPAVVCLGAHRVDAHSQPWIIAEAGVNHDGDVHKALALVDAAHEAAADAVKFQVFQADELVAADAPAAAYQQAAGAGDSQHRMLRQLELAVDDFRRVARHAAERGLAFLATPFGVDDLQVVLDLQVPAIKLASTDLDNVPLLEAAAGCERPVLMSTGASTLQEIGDAVARLDQSGAGERLILLHCVSSYPTFAEDAALATIAALRTLFGRWVGYSDHTGEIETSGLAVACGARVLEKHLTLDRQAAGPDHAMSLDPAQFRQYVHSARRAFTLMGQPRSGVAAVEQEVRRLARRSIVARSDIAAGDLLTAENLTVRRPAGGLPPTQWHQLIGRRAAASIRAHTRLSWEMIAE